jgi:hypothetical protein
VADFVLDDATSFRVVSEARCTGAVRSMVKDTTDFIDAASNGLFAWIFAVMIDTSFTKWTL